MNTLLLLGLLTVTNPAATAPNTSPDHLTTAQALAVFRADATTVDVKIQKPAGQRASVSLTDRYGELVHFERVARRHGKVHVRMHLHELPEGHYHLVVNDHQHRPVLRNQIQLRPGRAGASHRELAVMIP